MVVEIVTCDICGEPCMTEPADFGLPIKDLLTEEGIHGTCCGICGPKVEEFCLGQCQDVDIFPDGPLKMRLFQLQNIYMGQRALSVLTWLAERHATVDFHNSDLVSGAPANEVTVEVILDGASHVETGPTLEVVVGRLIGLEAN